MNNFEQKEPSAEDLARIEEMMERTEAEETMPTPEELEEQTGMSEEVIRELQEEHPEDRSGSAEFDEKAFEHYLEIFAEDVNHARKRHANLGRRATDGK